MTDSGSWIEKWSRRLLSWFSQREVKTPLAFYFRLVGAATVIIVVALYLAVPDQRLRIFEIGMAALLAVALLLGILVWFKIKSLVYGESGHRAEFKWTMGTEQRELTEDQISVLEGTENPKGALKIGDAK